MKTKKLLISLTALSLSLLLVTGCSKGDKESTSTKDTKEEQTSEESEEEEETETTDTEDDVDVESLDLPQLSTEVAEDETLVELDTTEGNIKMKLFPKIAPKAVENFVTHAKEGYYKDVIFHRVIKDFMIQTGDPDGTGMGGASIWKEEFAPEISNQLYHIDGALAMARTGGDVREKTQGSQFYIVHNPKDVSSDLPPEVNYPKAIADKYKEGGAPFLDTQYSVFGQVIEGMDTVDKISNAKTKDDKPEKEIKIKEVKILQEAK